MKVSFRQMMRVTFVAVICMYMFSSMTAFAAVSEKSGGGSKTKIQGTIVSSDGNLMKVQENVVSIRDVRITDTTKMENDRGMGVKAMVPGLTVKVWGIGNGAGEIEAKKIKLHPGVSSKAFAIMVAQQQEILDNKAAAGHAQTSADEGIVRAGAAQGSADQAQNTANQGLSTAQSATTMATSNAAGITVLNQRVSDLGDYDVVASTAVHFKNGSSRLSKDDEAALDQFMDANSSVNGYVVEIDGFTSSTGSRHFNQTLSDRRATAVAEYLREKDNVVAWRVVTPAGYGLTHPAADNSTSQGRAENRRVEVKILVSKGIQNKAVTTASNQ